MAPSHAFPQESCAGKAGARRGGYSGALGKAGARTAVVPTRPEYSNGPLHCLALESVIERQARG
jgi:hypothetical protein